MSQGARNGNPTKKIERTFKNAETQTENGREVYIPPKVLSWFKLESQYPRFFWKPQMVLLLLILCGVIGYFALTHSQDHSANSFVANSKL